MAFSKKQQTANPGKRLISKRRLAIAFVVATIADAVLAMVQAPPLDQILDLVTACILFLVLGWHILLLPALIAEAIPGLGIFPFWVLVVGSIAMFGTIRRSPFNGGDAHDKRLPGSDCKGDIPPVYDDKTDALKQTTNDEVIDIPFEDIPKKH